MTTTNEEATTANWMKEAQKGYIRVAVLILLNKKPSHGYEIMKEIKAKTGGFWTPTAGGVYPILRDLEKTKYIQGAWQVQNNRKIKNYKITESGTQILKHTLIKQNEIANNINALFDEFSRAVLNVEPTVFPTPAMHPPFSVFLEEEGKTEKSRDLKSLEQQRTQIQHMIKTMQEKLRIINTIITQSKKGSKRKAEKGKAA
jgi:DNA-binding PadR family transcriptional regulator